MEATEGRFKGTFRPIPFHLWNAIVGFHRQVSIDYLAESVTYHRWHTESQQYHTLIPHQKTKQHGLSVDVDWADERNVELLNFYAAMHGEEFLPACTVHTHVDVTAFESGTDAKDEDEAPGWHITIGKLISAQQYDTHFRMRLPKTKSLKQIVNVEKAYTLEWKNLFQNAEEANEWIHSTPGTTDFHQFLDRVHAS